MAERERTTAGSSTRSPADQQITGAQVDQAEVGEVEVRRSKRRKRTVSAYRDGDRVVVLLPARMSRAEERHWVSAMIDRIRAQEARRRPSDDELLSRAERLNHRYLGGRAVPNSVRWVSNQTTRWGSCTPSDRTVRLSSRLQGMPPWVVDYVLLHELAHLLEPGHTARFWELLRAYPRTDRARGYLEGVSAAASLGIEPCDDQTDADSGPAGQRDSTVNGRLDGGVDSDPETGPDAQLGRSGDDYSVAGWGAESADARRGQSDG